MKIETISPKEINELRSFLANLKFQYQQFSGYDDKAGVNIGVGSTPRLTNKKVETISLKSSCILQFYQKSNQFGMLKDKEFFSMSLHISNVEPLMTFLKMSKGVDKDEGSITRSLASTPGSENEDDVFTANSKPIPLNDMWKVLKAAQDAINKKADKVSSKNDLRLSFVALLSDHFDMDFASFKSKNKKIAAQNIAEVDELFNIPEIKQMQDAWKAKYGNNEKQIAKTLENSEEAEKLAAAKNLVEKLTEEQKRIANELEKAKQAVKVAEGNFKDKKQELEDSDTSKKKKENIDNMMAVAVKARDQYLKTQKEKVEKSQLGHPFINHNVDLSSLNDAYLSFEKALEVVPPKETRSLKRLKSPK